MPTTSPTPFLLGVNYPWLDYAEDFGGSARGHLGVSSPEKSKVVTADFARMRDCGVRVVRWFLFGDGRGGFVSQNGIPRTADEFLFKDVSAALQLAKDNEIKLCISLIDFLWLQDREPPQSAGQNNRVLQFAAGRAGFLQNVLIPLFREFHGHASLFAWEVANEPEWAIHEFCRVPTAKMHLADFRAFATEIVRAIHEFGGAAATLGSARLLWVRAWSGLHLDFYQAHYYPSAELDGNANFRQQLSSARALDKPLWLGELPARDLSASDYSLVGALNICRDAGLCGAAIWRWTKPEETANDADIGCVEPAALQTWLVSKRTPDLSV